jgi:exonuclease VII small subunit
MSDPKGETGFDKSARSLFDTLRTFEKEAEQILGALGVDAEAVSSILGGAGAAVRDTLSALAMTFGGDGRGRRVRDELEGVFQELAELRRAGESLASRVELLEAGQGRLETSLDGLEACVDRGRELTGRLDERIVALEARLAARRRKPAVPASRSESTTRPREDGRRVEPPVAGNDRG